MNSETLLNAIGKIDDELIAGAVKKTHNRRRWIKWGALAACAVLALAVTLAFPRNRSSAQTESQPRASIYLAAPSTESTATIAPEVSLKLNEIEAPEAMYAQIALLSQDFVAMTHDELLTYYGITLPVTEVLPNLTCLAASEGYGIYESANRGVYYDSNCFVFSDSTGTQRISVTLAKAFKHTYDFFDLTAEELQFTEVNGRALAVFHYRAEDGCDCYYTEFLQNDVAISVASEHITQEAFAACLQALVGNGPLSAREPHRVVGEITFTDHYAHTIGVKLDEGQGYEAITVHLPAGAVESYAIGQRVTITFTGEPATIGYLWPQQLVGIE